MAKVIKLNPDDLTPEEVLEDAANEQFQELLVIGWDAAGEAWMSGSGTVSGLVHLVQIANMKLMLGE